MDGTAQVYYEQLINKDSQVEDRYIAVFELKTIGNAQAVDFLMNAFTLLSSFELPSCLILHEIAYALGQLPIEFSLKVEPFLSKIIDNEQEFDVVRHEAAEALANLQLNNNKKELFEKYLKDVINDPINVLKDTCQVALGKINLYAKEYCGTREPAAPYNEKEILFELQLNSLNEIIQFLENPQPSLFQKYRVLYYLRNKKENDGIYQITTLLESDKLGALMKHEICFILGQIGKDCPISILPILERVCSDKTCAPIVRHEALAAFQTVNLNKEHKKEFLTKFVNDQEQIVRETARVSLKVSEFWNGCC